MRSSLIRSFKGPNIITGLLYFTESIQYTQLTISIQTKLKSQIIMIIIIIRAKGWCKANQRSGTQP